MKLTDEQIKDWMEHPVTEGLRDLIRSEVDHQKKYLVERYLAGNARPDSERDAILLMARWVESFLAMTPQEIVEEVEQAKDEKSERHTAGGIHGARGA